MIRKEPRTRLDYFPFRLAFLLIPLLIAVSTEARPENGTSTQSSKWKEVVVPIESSFQGADWCGRTSNLVTRERVLDSEGKPLSSVIFKLYDAIKRTNDRIDFKDDLKKEFALHSCSENGRYIFFVEVLPTGVVGSLHIYDTESKRFSPLLSSAERVPTDEPMSPDGKFILTKGTLSKKIRLPNGNMVTEVQIPFKKNKHVIGWVYDQGPLLLVQHFLGKYEPPNPMASYAVYDFRKRSQYVLRLDGVEGEKLVGATHLAKDRTKIYYSLMSQARSDLMTVRLDLYRKSIKEDAKPTLLVRDVNEFSVASMGEIVLNYYDLYSKRPGLYLARPDGSNVRPLTSHRDVEPAFSFDGKLIKFVRAPKAVSNEMAGSFGQSLYSPKEATLMILVRGN